MRKLLLILSFVLALIIAYATAKSETTAWIYTVSVYHNANQSIANDTETTLAFNSERYDAGTSPSATFAMHDNSTNNTRITFYVPGKYSIRCQVLWQNNTTGVREVTIQLNGGTSVVGGVNQNATGGTFETLQQATAEHDFAANDYVECLVKQTSGGSLNVLSFAPLSPSFTAHKIN